MMILWCNTDVGKTILGMVPLSLELWALSVVIGSLVLALHVAQIKIPIEKFDELNKKIGLDEDGA